MHVHPSHVKAVFTASFSWLDSPHRSACFSIQCNENIVFACEVLKVLSAFTIFVSLRCECFYLKLAFHLTQKSLLLLTFLFIRLNQESTLWIWFQSFFSPHVNIFLFKFYPSALTSIELLAKLHVKWLKTDKFLINSARKFDCFLSALLAHSC